MTKKIIFLSSLFYIGFAILPAHADGAAISPLKGCSNGGFNTAIGCIPATSKDMLTFFLRWGIGIGSGIAFLFIVYSGFLMMTSAGDPKRLQAGKELLQSAVGGLIFLIFAVFLLRFIGVDILGVIPG